MSHELLPNSTHTDRKILGELTADGRLSFAELGRRVSLSPPAVAERVQRLERVGVITGYRAEIDPRVLGYPLTAIVRVKPAPGQLPRIPELAAEIPEIGECHRITGEDCFYLKLHPPLDRRAQRAFSTASSSTARPRPRSSTRRRSLGAILPSPSEDRLVTTRVRGLLAGLARSVPGIRGGLPLNRVWTPATAGITASCN